MNSIDRQAYSIAFKDWREWFFHASHRLYIRLERFTRHLVIPFGVISCMLFILCLAGYVTQRFEVNERLAYTFFFLSTAGCFLSALSILAEKGFFTIVQAFSSLIGNTIVLTLALSFLLI